MEIASGLLKLKPNSNGKIEEWKNVLSSRLKEVQDTLLNEGVTIESWFIIEIDGQDYLLWYMRAKSIKRAAEKFQQSKHAIDQLHKEFIAEVVVDNGMIPASPLIDLST